MLRSFTIASVRSVAVIGLVLISAVGCGGAELSTTSGGSAQAGAATPESLHVITNKLSYGMTKSQVRHLVGPPTKIVRDQQGLSCWQYAVNQKFQGNLGQITLSSVRVCFFAGVYTVAHFKFNGKWDYQPPPSVTF